MTIHKCNKEAEIAVIKTDVKYIRQMLEDMKINDTNILEEVKKNSKFRNQATGIFSFIGFICGTIGAGIFWIVSKLWSD